MIRNLHVFYEISYQANCFPIKGRGGSLNGIRLNFCVGNSTLLIRFNPCVFSTTYGTRCMVRSMYQRTYPLKFHLKNCCNANISISVLVFFKQIELYSQTLLYDVIVYFFHMLIIVFVMCTANSAVYFCFCFQPK